MKPTEVGEPHHEEFSLFRFAATIGLSLAVLLAALRFIWPGAWAAQFLAPAWRGAAAFLALSLLNCFIEFIFHRYVLHMPAIPLLSYFYKQHTLHHSLTRIAKRRGPGGVGFLVVENKYPITEAEQGEASFFPWYSLAVFAAILTPLLCLLQWLAPSFPWFLSGFAALATSLSLYEILHAINHWPFETWAPLITHPRWGAFWRPVYAFHLRHHAVIDCNESISGFLGLPIADWVFGTCVIPSSIYADGEEWTPVNFESPRPIAPIAWLDTVASNAVKRRRAGVSAEKRTYSRGEEIAHWVTHGIGLAVSIAGLTLLVVFSSLRGTAWHVVSFTVFGVALLGLYSVSTLYHAYQAGRAKQFLLRLDHAAGFLLIAGTFTPILLTNLRGPWGWSLFAIIWGLCSAAAIYGLVFGVRQRLTSVIAAVFLAWLVVVAIRPLHASIPTGGLWLLLAGCLCYLIGAAFRHFHSMRYHRVAWQTFTLGGSTCHLIAVLLFLLPRTG